jgi:uncharacterized protein (DUF2249 family)/quercetin dioxygenase-like cupin family protein
VNPIPTTDLHDFNDKQIGHRVLSEDPVSRVLLVSLRAGQELNDHVTEGLITLYTLSGRLTLGQGDTAQEMPVGAFLRLAPGDAYRLRALEDARLLVTFIRPAGEALWNSLAPQGRDLDLRPVPRPQRHSTVFYAFDRLAPGESFFIVNDHDPQPLRFQIEQARPGQLDWTYEQRGPELFRIRLQRTAA